MKEGSPSAARIEAALGELLPPGAAVAVWSGAMWSGPEGVEPPLGPSERDAVANAAPKRRIEFARGRHCARQALGRAGWEGGLVEIPVGPERQPVWPAGFTGSITHCEGLVAAVVAPPAGGVGAIGLDAEPARPLPDDVRDLILTPEERALPGAETATVVFSAKESVQKAVHPRSGVWLDFLDVVLTLDRERGTFRAVPAPGASMTTPEVDALVGRYLLVEGFVISLAYLPG